MESVRVRTVAAALTVCVWASLSVLSAQASDPGLGVAAGVDGGAGPGRGEARGGGLNGAVATAAQILPPAAAPRVPPWSSWSAGGVFSPDGGSVVYERHLIKRGPDEVDLMVMASGEEPVSVLDRPVQMLTPSWSPDGTQVAVVTANFGASGRDSKLLLVDTTGSGAAEPVVLLDGRGGEIASAHWSPDGSTIAYSRYERDVFLYDVATGASRQLTHFCDWQTPEPPGPVPGSCPDLRQGMGPWAWSPDGTKLAGSVNKSWRVIDASTAEVVADLGRGWAASTVWSPDGKYVLVGTTSPSPRTWRFAADGSGEPRMVADSVASSWQACPDGSCPVFGKPRSRAKLTLRVSLRRTEVLVTGVIRPLTDESENRAEKVDLVLLVRKAGRWVEVGQRRASTEAGGNTFSAVLRRPDGASCRVQSTYAGGWSRTSAQRRVTFSC